MNSQLPQELRTSKLESLPEDARALAEDLIRKKFDVADIINGGSEGSGFFGQFGEPTLAHNLLKLTFRLTNGATWRVMQSLDQSMIYQLSNPSTSLGAGIFDDLARHISEKAWRQIEKEYPDSRIISAEAEMNERREQLSSPMGLSGFLRTNFNKNINDMRWL